MLGIDEKGTNYPPVSYTRLVFTQVYESSYLSCNFIVFTFYSFSLFQEIYNSSIWGPDSYYDELGKSSTVLAI